MSPPPADETADEAADEVIRVRAENIGGIDETTVEIPPGVTVLAGRNATNRTSFLRAIMAGLGSEHVSLKGDADEGRVELRRDDATYTRTLARTDGTVVAGGDPHLDDAELADLFAFLLESNEARRAVARGDDLREVIMRPVDTETIRADIDRLEDEKREVQAELDRLDRLEGDLPELEAERARLTDRIREERTALEEKHAEIETADADLERTGDQRAELEAKLDELGEARSELEDARLRLETERESLESLQDEVAQLEADLAELPEAPDGDPALDAELERLRGRRRELDSSITELQNLIRFNEDMLDGSDSDVGAALRDLGGAGAPGDPGESGDSDGSGDAAGPATSATGAVTDRLLGDTGSVVCWTCGTEVERAQIEATVDRLRELREEKLEGRRTIQSEFDDLKERRERLENERREREQVERKLDRRRTEIEDREARIDELKDRRAGLAAEIEELEAAVNELEHEEYDEVLDLHREANQLEFEIGRLEDDLAEVESEIESVERRLDERDRLRERREEIQEDLVDLRTRIERTEREAVEAFNDHVETVLDALEYENLERIWLERVEREAGESEFELHVVRSTPEGTTYEDTVDHLSESEREVTGLVFALAGYLVHDVHETVPFMLLDSLEALDAERIAALVEYLEPYPDYLVVALLPEDAAALDDDYRRVTDI